MKIHHKSEVKEEWAIRPEIHVLRAACNALIVLDGLKPMEEQALASIAKDLKKMIPNSA